jgi:ribosomal protein L7/L12
MLTLIKDWIKTATEEEVLELQKVVTQHTPQSVIIKKVIEFINDDHSLRAMRWIQEIKGVSLNEAKNIVDEIKFNN